MDDRRIRKGNSKTQRSKPRLRERSHQRHEPASSDVELTYIVSAFNRPAMLPVALWSIAGQSHQDFQCIVADNADDDRVAFVQKAEVERLGKIFPGKFIYVRTHGKTKVSDCYWAAEYAAKHALGRWLCFPCDDTYLVPEFAQRMLIEAAKRTADYVYVKHIVCGPEALGGPETAYAVWDQRLHRTAKTSFIVKRSVFNEVGGFQGKMDRPGTVNADYFFSSQMVAAKKRIACVDQVLLVHN